MIQLGKRIVPIYPNSGIIFENNGGIIEFKGACTIGNNSAISIGEKAKVEIGNKLVASTTLKIISFHHITFGENVRIGGNVCLWIQTSIQ